MNSTSTSVRIPWKEIIAEFDKCYDDVFLKRNAKAHFDFCGEVIDGAKERWRQLLLLDAVLCIFCDCLPSDHRSVRRQFEHHDIFRACILSSYDKQEQQQQSFYRQSASPASQSRQEVDQSSPSKRSKRGAAAAAAEADRPLNNPEESSPAAAAAAARYYIVGFNGDQRPPPSQEPKKSDDPSAGATRGSGNNIEPSSIDAQPVQIFVDLLHPWFSIDDLREYIWASGGKVKKGLAKRKRIVDSMCEAPFVQGTNGLAMLINAIVRIVIARRYAIEKERPQDSVPAGGDYFSGLGGVYKQMMEKRKVVHGSTTEGGDSMGTAAAAGEDGGDDDDEEAEEEEEEEEDGGDGDPEEEDEDDDVDGSRSRVCDEDDTVGGDRDDDEKSTRSRGSSRSQSVVQPHDRKRGERKRPRGDAGGDEHGSVVDSSRASDSSLSKKLLRGSNSASAAAAQLPLPGGAGEEHDHHVKVKDGSRQEDENTTSSSSSSSSSGAAKSPAVDWRKAWRNVNVPGDDLSSLRIAAGAVGLLDNRSLLSLSSSAAARSSANSLAAMISNNVHSSVLGGSGGGAANAAAPGSRPPPVPHASALGGGPARRRVGVGSGGIGIQPQIQQQPQPLAPPYYITSSNGGIYLSNGTTLRNTVTDVHHHPVSTGVVGNNRNINNISSYHAEHARAAAAIAGLRNHLPLHVRSMPVPLSSSANAPPPALSALYGGDGDGGRGSSSLAREYGLSASTSPVLLSLGGVAQPPMLQWFPGSGVGGRSPKILDNSEIRGAGYYLHHPAAAAAVIPPPIPMGSVGGISIREFIRSGDNVTTASSVAARLSAAAGVPPQQQQKEAVVLPIGGVSTGSFGSSSLLQLEHPQRRSTPAAAAAAGSSSSSLLDCSSWSRESTTDDDSDRASATSGGSYSSPRVAPSFSKYDLDFPVATAAAAAASFVHLGRYPLCPGKVSGPWCKPGSVVGLYGDGIGKALPAALAVGVIVDQLGTPNSTATVLSSSSLSSSSSSLLSQRSGDCSSSSQQQQQQLQFIIALQGEVSVSLPPRRSADILKFWKSGKNEYLSVDANGDVGFWDQKESPAAESSSSVSRVFGVALWQQTDFAAPGGVSLGLRVMLFPQMDIAHIRLEVQRLSRLLQDANEAVAAAAASGTSTSTATASGTSTATTAASHSDTSAGVGGCKVFVIVPGSVADVVKGNSSSSALLSM